MCILYVYIIFNLITQKARNIFFNLSIILLNYLMFMRIKFLFFKILDDFLKFLSNFEFIDKQR